jgi:hypothetical protein
MASFSGSIAGTNGKPGPQSQPRHPGDKPLSVSGEEYLALLWRETDASIRLDLAKYGEIRRWSWKHMPETKRHRGSWIGEAAQQPKAQPAL